MTTRILAFDLGAESGRGVVGTLESGRLTLDVVHRFPNGGVRLPDGLFWDALRLFEEMKQTLRLAAGKFGPIASVGVDTWGVDFALLGKGDALLANPRHYRDPHTEQIMEETFARVSREEIFHATGIQFMRFNSLFQLMAMQRDQSAALGVAESLLFMPDLFHFWLCGKKGNEVTNASTSQFFDPVAKSWAYSLFNRLGLPRRILGNLVQPGSRLGPLLPQVAEETGLRDAVVIAPATHDTGAAVAAVPAEGNSWCYISSGTWSLMGVEIPAPIIDERPLLYNFTNEAGFGGTTRFLKNIMGLWLVQECRRDWERKGHTHSYEDLTHLAERSAPFVSLIDPDHASFMLPASMPQAIAAYCTKTDQPAPVEPGAVIRCALESLALRYRWVLDRLEEMLGKRIDTIHIVGGGSQNRLLNQLTADACNRAVVAGPVETTALGNIIVQAIGLGAIQSLAEGRQVIRHSFGVERYEPREPQRWDEAADRFGRLLRLS
jgi:rhamnulokinase